MAEPLKYTYNEAFMQRLADVMTEAHPPFDAKAFQQSVFAEGWEDKELMDRLHHITRSLRPFLPEDYAEALVPLKKAASQFEVEFFHMFFPDFAEMYGLDDPKNSLPALEHFTQYSSSEFAIRPFIKQDPEGTMAQMLAWADHENYHVRRLSSEGCRPRLPWGLGLPFLKKDPSPILPVLEKLQNDPEEYVRRSVANNLNDISKDHPELVLDIAERWIGQSKDKDRLVKHALRGLLKAGNTRALMLFGFTDPKAITIEGLTIDRTEAAIGDSIAFSFSVTHSEPGPQLLRIEYHVHYQKAKGKVSPKVFQLTEKEFPAGATAITKSHSFEERSTRKHYPGAHRIVVTVNGVEKAETELMLTA